MRLRTGCCRLCCCGLLLISFSVSPSAEKPSILSEPNRDDMLTPGYQHALAFGASLSKNIVCVLCPTPPPSDALLLRARIRTLHKEVDWAVDAVALPTRILGLGLIFLIPAWDEGEARRVPLFDEC
ncbi:hypothetical protein Micbo1qcDRAFT_178910 [Microdochium bolleyi]|uniref:Uncharacterized protein n=1 Tax=Microdochium bolleyi TaxID=196109 RepID=A0A136IR53_9PEZI|nr:hypothetical protein Micbo1qcDRAFT_178910 [Microdochium bolleyi]